MQLKNRNSWCISRQRCWGTPIPAFYKADGSVIVSEDISNAVAECIEKYGTDVWWERTANELFPKKALIKVYCCVVFHCMCLLIGSAGYYKFLFSSLILHSVFKNIMKIFFNNESFL